MILMKLLSNAVCPLYRNGSPGATLHCNTPRTVCRCVVLRPPSPVLVDAKKKSSQSENYCYYYTVLPVDYKERPWIKNWIRN